MSSAGVAACCKGYGEMHSEYSILRAWAIAAAVAGFWVVNAAAITGGADGGDVGQAIAARRIIVRFAPRVAERAANAKGGVTGIGAIDAIGQAMGVTRMRPLHRTHGRRGGRGGNRPQPLADVYVVELGDAMAVEAARAYGREKEHVIYAEPDYVVRVAMTPDDPFYSSAGTWGQSYDDLWALKQNRLDCAPAWDIAQGDGVVVAVIDTGADYLHEDLASAVWENAGEVPDNGIDDDGNGYVDDIVGWSFATYGGAAANNEPWDGHGHGTHCAGTIAGVGNNGIGIIGVAPQARIMVLKGLGDGGSGYTSDLAASIVYAVDNGADVLSCSWGSAGTSQTLIDAFDYAQANGVVNVAAAGNNNSDAVNYSPANIETVIAVAATDAADAKAGFSNYGTLIDVAAPGVDILSLRADGTSMGSPVNAAYTRANGTSMACPHAAGVCALIMANTPGIAPETVRAILRATADDIGDPGVDIYSGYGRVNARRAVEFDVTGLCFADIVSPTAGPILPGAGLIEVSGSAYGDSFDHYYLEYMDLADSAGWIAIADSAAPVESGSLGTWDARELADGNYVLNLRVLNTAGDVFVSSRQVWIDNASITHPVSGQICNNKDALPIEGTAAGSGFQAYTIDVARDEPTLAWSAAHVSLSDGGLVPKIQDALGTFDTTSVLQSGDYLVRLTVSYADGRTETDIRAFAVDVDLASGWPVQVETITDAYTYHKPYFNVLGSGAAERRIAIVSGTDIHIYNAQGTQMADWVESWHDLYYPLAVADLDGDGSDDMVTNMRLGDGLNGEFAAYNGNGVLLPGWPVTVTLPGGGFYGLASSPPAIADLDGDGAVDVVAHAYNHDGVLALYALHGDGALLPGWPVSLPANDVSSATMARLSPAVADLDGDGFPEVIMGTYANGLHVLRHDGTPLAGWPVAEPAKIVNSPVVGDVDADGTVEIVAATTNGRVFVFEADATTAAGWPVTVDRRDIAEIALADLDSDGDLEIVFCGMYAQPGGTAHWEMLYVYHHDGSPAAGWPQSLSPGMHGSVPVVGDLDGDGDLEIVACRGWTGLGAFQHDGELLWHKEIGDNSKGRNYLLLADADGDGLLELLSGNDDGYALMWDMAGTAAPWAAFQGSGRFTGAYDFDFVPEENNPPTLHPIGDRATGEGRLLAFTVTGEDPDGDTLRFLAQGIPPGAVFTDDADADSVPDGFGSFSWTPAAGQAGVYPVTFTVSDGALTDTREISITVTNLNAAPVAADDAYALRKRVNRVPAPGVLGNDSDPDGDPLSIILVSDVSGGELRLDADGGFTYRPVKRGAQDSFQYRLTDGQDASPVATVAINGPAGNTPPVADNQSVDVVVNTAKDISLTASDADNDSLTYSIVALPINGDLVGAPPSVTYTPALDYEGPDSFTFRVNDGTEDSNIATVSLSVTAASDNRPPVAQDDAYVLTKKMNRVSAPGVLANDSDPDGDSLTAILIRDASAGKLTLSSNGSFSYKHDTLGAPDSFQYTVSDGKVEGNVVTVHIN